MRKGLSPSATVHATCTVFPALLGESPKENGNIFGRTVEIKITYRHTNNPE